MKRSTAGWLVAVTLVMLAAAVTLRGRTSGGPGGAGEGFLVTNARDAGPGSLRDAILAADRAPDHARILITVKRLVVESALPPLANARGIDIDASPGSGVIDAGPQASGATLQIESPGSSLRGLKLLNAHGSAVVVNAPGAHLESVTVASSKVGILLGAAAQGCVIRSSVFDGNETGITTAADVADIEVLSSVFRSNTRAGIWLVGAAVNAGGGAAPPGAAGHAPAAASRVRLRLIDGVFESNAAGIVAGNRAIAIQKSRFIDNRESAVLILGGAALIEDSEIRGSGGSAVSVVAGQQVVVARNSFVDNLGAAVTLRDSDAVVERNVLRHNGLGIVSVLSRNTLSPVIRDNLITQTTADAVTLIGGSPQVQGNQILDNQGAGVRALDLVSPNVELKAAPRLGANVLKGNKIDMAAPGVYRLTSSP